MFTERVHLSAYTHDRGGFSRVRDKNVLLYWPHGFGDWVQFSVVLPFLEPSNRYWITRFGDDTVTLFENFPYVSPVYLGTTSPLCDDGGHFGIKNFNLKYEKIDGGEVEATVPLSLHQIIEAEKITVLLWTWYPETKGLFAPPIHSKARWMLRNLAPDYPEAFESPLPPTISFDVDPVLLATVEARLKNFCGFGPRRLCIIGRNGYSSLGKNWGHKWRDELPADMRKEGQECKDFIRQMLTKSKNWCFLLMEDRDFPDSVKDPTANTFSYAEVFGSLGSALAPFAKVLKCLLRLAELCVGVPIGPYHLAAQFPQLPTIGIWLEHLPSWYDEPRDGLVHVIGSIAAMKLGSPGSFLTSGNFNFKATVLDSRNIPGEAVMSMAESLLGSDTWSGGSVECSIPRIPTEWLRHHALVDEVLDKINYIPPPTLRGRGVVMCAGGRYWPSAWVALNRLRSSGCDLPVQLWYLGPNELTSDQIGLLAELKVECIDALELRKEVPARILNGWELKAYSIINSKFDEVLLLDADNIVVKDPTYLFDCEGYRRHGALFWPDRVRLSIGREIWPIFRVEFRDEPEFEAGQMLINKARCWKAIGLTMHFNEHSDFYYQYMYGDKDTYHMAWRFLNQEYALIPHAPVHEDDVFYHRDEMGQLLFQHGVKWNFDDPRRSRKGFQFESECQSSLETLRVLEGRVCITVGGDRSES